MRPARRHPWFASWRICVSLRLLEWLPERPEAVAFSQWFGPGRAAIAFRSRGTMF